jgi:protein subunit release factor A
LFSVSIADCDVQAIASTKGGGGQNRNRRHTAIRVVHPPSGAAGFSADEREQLRNKRAAFRRMAESSAFQAWARQRAAQMAGEPPVEELVERAMQPAHLKIETRDAEGRWTI